MLIVENLLLIVLYFISRHTHVVYFFKSFNPIYDSFQKTRKNVTVFSYCMVTGKRIMVLKKIQLQET